MVPTPHWEILGRDISMCVCLAGSYRALSPSIAVLQGEYLGQKVAVKNIKCDVTAQAFLDETAVMT